MSSAARRRGIVGAALLATLVAIPVAASNAPFRDDGPDVAKCDHARHAHPSPAHAVCAASDMDRPYGPSYGRPGDSP